MHAKTSPRCGEDHHAEIQREESREWTVLSKRGNESGNDMPALSTRLTKNAKDEEGALSASERIGDSTEHDQAGVHRDPIHRRSDSESSDGREIPAALADVCRDQNCSHSNTELCDGWALTAAMALHSRRILARRFQHSIQRTLEPTRDPSRKSTACSPAAVLEQ